MKHILIFFALLFCSVSYGQIQDWNIKIRSGQDTDSTYVLLSDTTGQFAGRGRWYSLAILADLIEGYISSGGISDGDKGDITVSGSGATWNIDANTIGATEIAVTGVTAGTYNYPGSIKVDADGRIELISSLGDPPLTSEVDGDITNEGSLTVEAGGATTSEIHSNTSGSTDVTLNAAWGLDISENTGTGNITYIADSSQVATQYDLTQITGTADHDFYETATTTPPNANTDNMFNDGAVAIGNDGPYITNGLTLHAGFDAPHLRFYGASSPEYSWSFNIGDDGGLILYNVSNGGAAVFPFKAEDGATVNSQLLLQADGDIQISDYPNSRDDGSPTNVLGTDINGVVQSYPVADVQPTTEAIQDIVGAMFTGNTEANVTVDYQDADGTIDVVVSGGSDTKPALKFTWDGNGGVISTGSTIYTVLEYAVTVTGWSIVATGTSPTTTIDVWRVATGTTLPTVSNTIMGTKPALASGNAVRSSTLTGWSPTAFSAGDIIGVNIDALANATWMQFKLEVQ